MVRNFVWSYCGIGGFSDYAKRNETYKRYHFGYFFCLFIVTFCGAQRHIFKTAYGYCYFVLRIFKWCFVHLYLHTDFWRRFFSGILQFKPFRFWLSIHFGIYLYSLCFYCGSACYEGYQSVHRSFKL